MNNSLDNFIEDGFCDLGNIIDDSGSSNEKSNDLLRTPQLQSYN